MKSASRPLALLDFRRRSLPRHLFVLCLAAALLAVFGNVHGEWSPMHRWNRAFGDISIVFVALSVAIGPMARLLRPSVQLIPFRRELGIHACLFAFVHAAIVLSGWVELDLMRLFGFEWHPVLATYVMVQHGFALANAIGVMALVFVLVLAATSSDFAVRKLGASGWKFIQMGVLPLWWLTVGHVAYFLFAHFLSFHRDTPEANPLQWLFVALVAGVFSIRIGAYVVTVRSKSEAAATAGGSGNALASSIKRSGQKDVAL